MEWQKLILVFLSFWTARACPKLKQQQKIRFRERLALFEQKKMALVFGNLPSDFGKISHRLWGKTRARFWGNTGSVLGKTGSIWGKMFWFLNWLATKLKSHCFEREACLGLDLLFFLHWVSLK